MTSISTSLALWANHLLDPRGRCNRYGLAWVAFVMLPAQLALLAATAILVIPWTHPVVLALKCAFIWMAVAAVIKRLHDLGRGAIWMLIGSVLFVIWSFAVALAAIFTFGTTEMVPGTPMYLVVLGLNTAFMLAALLYLHFKKGDQGPNAYGPAPDNSGFSSPVTAATSRTAIADDSLPNTSAAAVHA